MTAVQLIAASAWKGTVILLCGFGATTILHRASAALRHFVWVAAFLALLALPTALRVAPKWRIPVTEASPRESAAVLPAAAAPSGRAVPAPAPVPWLFWVWLSGAGATGIWFLAGAIRMFPVVRRSAPAGYAPEIGFPIRAAASVLVPLAWGIWRPVVLLPDEARNWPMERLRSAVLHEASHIRRHDLLVQLVVEVVCSLYWFHPLVWLAAIELRKEREHACDDTVLRAGVAAPEYASHLMALARTLTDRRIHAPAMAERSNLEVRVRALLDRRRNRNPLNASAAAAITVCCLGVLLPVALVRAEARTAPVLPQARLLGPLPQAAQPESVLRTVPITRPVVQKLVTQASPSAPARVAPAADVSGPISGVVLDPSGARVPGCQVTAMSIDGSNTAVTTVTGPTGGYQFEFLPRGQYMLRFEAPGFAQALALAGGSSPLYIKLAVGGTVESIVVGGQKPSVVGVAPLPAPQRIRVGGNVQAARLISQSAPVYPAELQQLGIEGSVVIKAVITASGEPRGLAVVNSGIDPRLVQAALEAVSQWRYQPTLLNGEPVAVETTVTVEFKLQP